MMRFTHLLFLYPVIENGCARVISKNVTQHSSQSSCSVNKTHRHTRHFRSSWCLVLLCAGWATSYQLPQQ